MKNKTPSQNQLNLYGVIFIYAPYMNEWIAYANSTDHRNHSAGLKLDYYPYRAENVETLRDYIYENGYKKIRTDVKDSFIARK